MVRILVQEQGTLQRLEAGRHDFAALWLDLANQSYRKRSRWLGRRCRRLAAEEVGFVLR
jgi:hypothetical protein